MSLYYQDGSVKIYHRDCREMIVTLGPVDHIITDPPYSKKTEDGARTLKGRGKSKGATASIDFGSVDIDFLRMVFGNIDCRRWLIATVDIDHAVALKHNPIPTYEPIRIGAWVKPNGAPQFTGDRPAQGWEAVAIHHRKKKGVSSKMRWNGGGLRACWVENIEHGDHPTQKPLRLLNSFISLFTDTTETVLDPFCGSGTTLRACKDLGRKAIGIEIDERYCEIAAKRCSQESFSFEALTKS